MSLGPLIHFSVGTRCRSGFARPHCIVQSYLLVFSAASSTSSLTYFLHRGMIYLPFCSLKAPTPLFRTVVKQGVSETASISQLNGTVDGLGHEVIAVGFDVENLRV